MNSGTPTVLDVGRAVPGTASAHLFTRSDAVVVAARGDDAAQMRRLAGCAPVFEALEECGVRVGLAVTGQPRYSEVEIVEATGTLVWGPDPLRVAGAAVVRARDRTC